MMVEQFTDYKVIVIEGEYSNIKVTTPKIGDYEDLLKMRKYKQNC